MSGLSRPRVLVAWSSGKDSAWALHRLRADDRVDVVGLLTTVNEAVERVAMHAVRIELLEAQAAAVGLDLFRVDLPWPCPNSIYEARMAEALVRARETGITQVAFGDLFLEEIRAYRERQMAGTGIEPIFPLWGLPTGPLASKMIEAGLRAVLTCVDPAQLAPEFVGRTFDERLLIDLPDGVDPCGEHGEFHTFCVAGPSFATPIEVARGETVERDGFWFADLLPAGTGQSSSSGSP